jgi:hypothetical protein
VRDERLMENRKAPIPAFRPGKRRLMLKKQQDQGLHEVEDRRR